MMSVEELKSQIKNLIKGEVADDSETLVTFSKDASLFTVNPEVVVFPKDSSDIQNLVDFINKNPGQNLSLTARSAGTDMSGGPLSQSIILGMTKYFNQVLEVGEDYAITQPGVYYRDFERETLKKNLLLPCYPASRELCTVGGMVANNSAGEKTLSYGKMEDFVEELKVIFADGREYTVKPLNESELKAKMKEKTYEGQLYSKVYKLVNDNSALLAKAKPRVTKNSAGYYLWNVWNGKTFDLTKLIVGSQGTLGIVTQIKTRLIKPKTHSKLVVVFLKSIDQVPQIVDALLAYKPESFESYDDYTLSMAMRYLPEIIKYFKMSNVIKLFFQFIPEMFMTLTGGLPKLVLMAEFTGDSEEEVNEKCQKAYEAIQQFNVKSRITTTEEEAKKYWVIRRQSFDLLRHHLRGKHTAPFIDDIIVPPQVLPEFMPKLEALLKPYPKLLVTMAGHIGNGNFHIIPLTDLTDPELPKTIRDLSEKVYALVIEYGGSITAEHNDGIIRTPFLEEMYGKKVYELFEETKTIFDPNNIFNPGKKVGGTIDFAMQHLLKKN